MMAAEVAALLGDERREGPSWRCRCPLHGGRSLILRDGRDGTLLVTCWGGCERLEILAELRRRGLLGSDIGHRLPTATRSHRFKEHTGDATRVAGARAIWESALPSLESPVERYLAGREITIPPPPTLRWSPRCWHNDERKEMPAMVAVVEHVERGIVGIHRTYLTADLRRHSRRSLGPIGGGAVRLGEARPGEWLAIGEGIETTLAVMMASAMPGWAALSANGIRSLILPPEATLVLICADHDLSGVGQGAANDAAVRWIGEGRRVRMALPPKPGTDFADVLLADVSATGEARHVA
jgi:putative DNA primase/helicase